MSTEIREPAASALQLSSGYLLPLLRAAVRRKRMIGVVALAIVAAAAVAALLLPDFYTAECAILPPQQGGSSAGMAMMAQMGGLGAMASAAGGLSMKNPNDQQLALLTSRTVEDAMVERFHLKQVYHKRYDSSARKKFEKHTKTDNGQKDGLIRLSVTDTDPRRAAEMANGWIEEYRHLSATLAITEASQRRLFFERQLAGAREDLTRAEDELKQTEQRTGVIELDGQAHAMIASAAILRGQVAAKRVEIQAMRQFAADENPDLVRALQELSTLEGQLSSMDVANTGRGGDLVAPKGQLTEAGLEYARQYREVKYHETVVTLLGRQFEVARVDEARQGSSLQIVDRATVPDRPNSHYRLIIFIAGLLLAFPLGLLAARGADAWDQLREVRRRSGSWTAVLLPERS